MRIKELFTWRNYLAKYPRFNKLVAAILVVLALGALFWKAYAFASVSFLASLVWILIMPKQSAPKKKRYKTMFGSIENTDHARAIVKDVTMGFYALLAIRLLVSMLLVSWIEGLWFTIIETLIVFFIVYKIRKHYSRVAAFILGALIIVSFVIGFIEALIQGGANSASLGFTVLLLWYAVRAEKATRYLRAASDKKKNELDALSNTQARVAKHSDG